jgi:hypothetical protein
MQSSNANGFTGLLGRAVLAIWSDADPEHEDEFNRWYTHQHLPERVCVPGFRRGRRYRKDGPGALRYFTLYETDNAGVLASQPYLDRLNDPTEWTRKVMPYFTGGGRRAVMTVTSTAGAGAGGAAATIEFGVAGGREAELREWLARAGQAELDAARSLIGWHLCEPDEAVTRAKAGTAEARAARPAGETAPPAGTAARPAPPAAARWMLLAEATGTDGLDAGARLLLGSAGLAAHGAVDVGEPHSYRLMCALS